MQDLGYELPRILIPHTTVHKGKRKRRGCYAPALRYGCRLLYVAAHATPPSIITPRIMLARMSSVRLVAMPLLFLSLRPRNSYNNHHDMRS